jgi:hypothetical protein
MTQAHDCLKSDGASIDQWYTPTPTVHAEDGILFDNPHVCQKTELQPTGHCMAGDSSNDRFLDLQTRRAHWPAVAILYRLKVASVKRIHIRWVLLLLTGEVDEVGSGAEISIRAGQNSNFL